MSFEKAMSKMKFDVRLLEYNLAQGYITKDDYNKHLSQLEDSAHLISLEEDINEDVESEVQEETESH